MTFPVYQPDLPAAVKRAKTLRRAMTEPENRLWWALRTRLPDYKFRRQFVIGHFIVDFCCIAARLVVEVDGNQHGTEAARKRDAQRTASIEAQRFRVIRFANEDVMTSVDSVLDTIFGVVTEQLPLIAQMEGPPPPAPPRKGEGRSHG